MRLRKTFCSILIIFNFTLTLYSAEKSSRLIENTILKNYAANKDNSILIFNTVSYDDWHNIIYAVNPGKEKLQYEIKKVWDKNTNSNSVRSLIYSPFSENFYFISAWGQGENEDYYGIFKIETKNNKNINDLNIVRTKKIAGIGHFLVNKKGVWLLKDTLATKNNSYWGYSELYQIENEKGSFINNEINILKQIKAMSFFRAEDEENFNDDTVPSNIFQNTDYTLLIKDEDNTSWWNYDCVKQKSNKYSTYDEAINAAEKLDEKYTKRLLRKECHFCTMLILIILLTITVFVFLIIYIVNKKHSKKTNTESIKERNRMIFEIQEKERAKISRDIHDSVVQDIRVIRLETENLVVDEESKSKQTKIEDIATDCIIKLRNICYNLTPAELTIHNKGESSKLELISIINSLVQQFSSRTHFPCLFKVEEGFEYPVLEKEVTQNLFRVIQEVLNNIEKHSYATQASIFIKEENGILQIYITDDGIGCNQEELQKKLQKKEHLGLRSMIDRMELIGGKVEFFTAQDDGMEVKISLPLENK